MLGQVSSMVMPLSGGCQREIDGTVVETINAAVNRLILLLLLLLFFFVCCCIDVGFSYV